MKKFMGFIVKKASADLNKRSEAYQKQTESNVYEQNVYVDQEIKVSVDTKTNNKTKPQLEDLELEEVEFEEL